jgi:hypothetical protein
VRVLYDLYVVSYALLLFNLLPIYPLDGGRILQELLWFRLGHHRSMMIATQTGMVGAVALGMWGLAGGGPYLLAIAIFGFLTCWQQRQMLRMGGFAVEEREPWAGEYDFSRGYGGMPDEEAPRRKKSGGWFTGRREGSWERKQEQLRREQEEVDRILAKVSREGLGSLSRKEKRTLQQATERQRERDRVDRL